MNRLVYQAIRVEYSRQPVLKISVDGTQVTNMGQYTLPSHNTFRGRRITLPVSTTGYVPHLEIVAGTGNSYQSLLQNDQFEAVPIENFSQQQLFHYYDVGLRGSASGTLTIYVDGVVQEQTVTYTPTGSTDNIRIYFDPISYGYIPHIHNTGIDSNDFEILWARPVALPPRFYRGLRTHSEFQITYKGSVTLEWFLDGLSKGQYSFDSTEVIGQDADGNDLSAYITKTEKAYFPSGTVGHVLQYKHTNPASGGKIYMIETDQTLADLEQQAMRPQVEEG